MVHALFPAQVEQFFILYPNPEPHNPAQRWLNMPFFEFLLSRLKPNGTITLASNIPEYIDEAEQQLIELWKLPYQKQKSQPIQPERISKLNIYNGANYANNSSSPSRKLM